MYCILYTLFADGVGCKCEMWQCGAILMLTFGGTAAMYKYIYTNTNTQIYKYANIQIYNNIDIQIYNYPNTNTNGSVALS